MTPPQVSDRANKIAVSMIVGNDYTDEKWERVVKSVEPYVDGIYVNYNGTQNQEPSYVPDNITFTWVHFDWQKNFALARNQAFSLISMDKYDWVIWIDLDDEARNFDKLDEMLTDLHKETQVVMLRYQYATDPKMGEASANQDRERIFRTDLKGKWINRIHELYKLPAGVQIAKRLTEDAPFILHHKQEAFADGKDDGTRERNKEIIISALKDDPNDPRLRFYLANEFYAEAALAKNNPEIEDGIANAMCDTAIRAYEVYLQLDPPLDEAYITTHQMAELYRMSGRFLEATETEFQATMIHADWPEAWIGIAENYLYMNDWDKAIFYASVAKELTSEPETPIIREPLNAKYKPLSIMATAYEQKGELEKAKGYYEQLSEFSDDKDLLTKIEDLETKISHIEEEEVSNLREENYGKNPEKSIAFWCRRSLEQWSSKSMAEGGIGGTETAICEIAKRFAADGWRTAIFATPPDDIKNTIYDGIEWYDSDEVSLTEPWNTIVSVRTPELFDSDFNCDNRVLWLHDMNNGPGAFENDEGESIADKIDYIIGVSDWHCRHLSNLYKIPLNRFLTIQNGVNLERFEDVNEIPKQSGKFIWPSSPDRGVDIVLEMWDDIKAAIPEAEFHIFYGWDNFDAAMNYTNNFHMRRFKTKVLKLLEKHKDNGVFWRGRIDQDELAHEFKTSEILPYFSEFCETNWISGIECQAAHCVPIISDIGAAPSNLSEAGHKIKGFANNDTYKRLALEKIIEVHNRSEDNIRWDNKIMDIFVKPKTWDNSYEGWKTIVKEETESVEKEVELV